MTILVTGAAGFIGFHLVNALSARGEDIVGFDNVNDYYDVQLKEARLQLLSNLPRFTFVRGNLEDPSAIKDLFEKYHPEIVINLGAQAGVRYSLTNPQTYIQSNLVGFLNVLDESRRTGVKHFVYASSSSVYGLNTKMPFSTTDGADHPVSLYAATKRSNELIAHSYSQCFGLPTTGLRFFTVYGPWGRPDMALFMFTKAILNDKPIEVFNHGNMKRNFTYIDDVIDGTIRAADHVPNANVNWNVEHSTDPSTSSAPFRIFNIGSKEPTALLDMISLLETELGRTAEKILLPMQTGDVPITYADISTISEITGYSPQFPLNVGISRFVAWYRDFYGI